MGKDKGSALFSLQEKDLLKCAFEVEEHNCNICSLKNAGICSSPDEGNGFNLQGQKLLKRLGIIE